MKKALLIILLSFQFIAHAQWTSYNLPQGFPVYHIFNNLIYSSNNTVWANYASGNVPTYRSVDGGASFKIVKNIAYDLFQPINDTLVYAISYQGSLLKSKNAFNTFDTITILGLHGDTGFKEKPILDMYFYNDSVGWVLGDDTTSGCKEIWRTENGGILWQRLPCAQINIQNTPLGPNNFYKKSSAQNKLFLLNTKLRLDKSKLIVVEDDGKTWIQRAVIPGLNLFVGSFVFIDSLHGIVGVHLKDTTFAMTHDGGLTWTFNQVSGFVGGKIAFVKGTSQKRSFLISAGSSGAFISYDTAKTWIMIDDYWHSNISFYDAETGISMTQPTPQRNGAIHVFNGYLPDPVGLKENHQQSLNLKVFPNPAQHVIYVRASNVFGVSQISIYDVTGKKVHNQTSSQLQTEIPITHLNTGMYFLRMVSENGEISFGKFYVQN